MVLAEESGRSRPVCPACHYVAYQNPVPGVGVLCEVESGLVLVRRAKPPHQGKWTLPSGYIEADESAEQAALRECKEETGLDVELVDLFGVGSFPEGSLSSGIVVFYRTRPVGGELRAGDDAAEVRVFGLGEIPEIPFRTHREVVARWIEAQRTGPHHPRPGVVIRPAQPEDEERILALLVTVPANAGFTAVDLERARQRFREKLGFDVLVAQVDGVLVGYLVLSLVPALSGLRAWIDDVVVDPVFQRQGLGAALVEAAVHMADNRGATHLFVNVRRGNPGAREFYRACGFDEDGVAPLRIW
jgi:ADP-ribose pyrophosphatase YjhB (NUDIX family)/ribosomal protein S18 acetylase RimI-like enzyme